MRKNVFMNNLKFITISFGLSLLYCWITNRFLLSGDIDLEVFREANASIYGYSSLQSYFLIYFPIFFLLLNFFMKEEKDYRTVRLKSRKRIGLNRMKSLGKTVGIVVLPHFSVQILCNLFIFGKASFICAGYFAAEALQMINVVMAYFIFGLCFETIILYFKHEVGLFIVILVSLLYYFVNRIFLNYILLRDLCIRDLMIGGNYGTYEFPASFIKNSIILFVLVNWMFMRLKETDVYER